MDQFTGPVSQATPSSLLTLCSPWSGMTSYVIASGGRPWPATPFDNVSWCDALGKGVGQWGRVAAPLRMSNKALAETAAECLRR